MRPLVFVLAGAALPMLAQAGVKSAPEGGHWNAGLFLQSPTFEGNYRNVDGGQLTRWDTQSDLGLGKDKAQPGIALAYEGRRFRLALAAYGMDYAGHRAVSQDVTVDGTTYQAGADVRSALKLKDYSLDWTIKVYRWDRAYLGVDLGLNAWVLDVRARGQGSTNGGPVQYQEASFSGTLPIPQLGLSVGGHLGATADLRAYYHFLSRSGATYHRAGAEATWFPLRWVGVRAAFESEGFDVPQDSFDPDLALKLDKNGGAFGVVFRF